MSEAISRFKLKKRPTREHAKNWLVVNCVNWPNSMRAHISDNKFHGWRFVRTLDGEVLFGNCIDPDISEKELGDRQ